MGQRGEIYSTRVFADEGAKTFFFNIKENRFHDKYLNIVESRKTDRGFKRSSIVVFSEDIEKFTKVLNQSIAVLRDGRQTVKAELLVGGGRRRYDFLSPPGAKKVLRVVESREDATGSRRESIMVSLGSMKDFIKGLEKAISAM